MSAPRRGCAWLLASLVLLGALAAPARAQTLGGAVVDFVRVDGHGRHEAIVSVIDPDGHPIGELEHAFGARLDGHEVAGLGAQSMRARFPRVTLTLVVDGTLLGRATLPALQEAIKALGHEMAPNDRIVVLAAGRSLRARAGTAAGVGELAAGLGELADAAAPQVFDALYQAAHDQARRGEREAGAIVLVTHGADGGSTHTSLEALALARTIDRLTPVTVVFVGDEGTTEVSDRLTRLAEHSSGAISHASSPEDLASALPQLFGRELRRWVLTFDVPGWDAHVANHQLEVVVTRAGETRAAPPLVYATADVTARAWWQSAWVWILPALLLVGLAAWWLASRPRQQCLLVHDGDDQDGVWYEVFRLPVRVGAAEGNDIVFADLHVSRQHAVFERRGRTVELVDLNSENGTLVNAERVTRRVLADGDRVSLGPDVHLVFEAR